MDFSGMSLIKLRKEEMESQVSHVTARGLKSDYKRLQVCMCLIFRHVICQVITSCLFPAPQVKVLELESHLENERLRLGELRKKHYELAGVPLEQVSEGNGETSSLAHPATMSPKPTKPALMKKPALAQKPNIPPKATVRAVKRSLCCM